MIIPMGFWGQRVTEGLSRLLRQLPWHPLGDGATIVLLIKRWLSFREFHWNPCNFVYYKSCDMWFLINMHVWNLVKSSRIHSLKVKTVMVTTLLSMAAQDIVDMITLQCSQWHQIVFMTTAGFKFVYWIKHTTVNIWCTNICNDWTQSEKSNFILSTIK